ILANQSLFRLGIALDLLYCVGVAVVLAAYYVILRSFGPTIALVAAVCRVLFAGLWALSTVDLFGTMRLLKGAGELRGFSQEQVQAAAAVPLSIRWDYYYTGLLFWGMSTALFSYLWLKSPYIQRAFAAFGILTGMWAALCAFVFIADPAFASV